MVHQRRVSTPTDVRKAIADAPARSVLVSRGLLPYEYKLYTTLYDERRVSKRTIRRRLKVKVVVAL